MLEVWRNQRYVKAATHRRAFSLSTVSEIWNEEDEDTSR
jgi:hypothetical protein